MVARSLNKLSAAYVTHLTKPGRHSDGGGLYLSIDAQGRRRWVFIFRWHGKNTELGLGGAAGKNKAGLSLAQARDKAEACRRFLREGKNPKEQRQPVVQVPTFGMAADSLIEGIEAGFRNEKHRAQWAVTLGKVPYKSGHVRIDPKMHKQHVGALADLRSLRVNEVATEDVLRVLRPIWFCAPETASRLRGRIERVLDGARVNGFRTGENPARWKGHLDAVLPPPKKLTRGHHAAMEVDELPSFVGTFRDVYGTSARALEFLILCASRTSEVREMRWSEVDLAQRIWIIPAQRMKAGREHRVPLAKRAVELLSDQLPDDGAPDPQGFVFPGSRPKQPLSVMAFDMLLRRQELSVTTHGFRSTFRMWCAEETPFPREVAEAALAHSLPDRVEAAYQRSNLFVKRRGLMEAWAAFLDVPPRPNLAPPKAPNMSKS